MKIDEILGKALPFKVERNTGAHFQATFEAGGREILFMAENEGYQDEADEGQWFIAFGEKTVKRSPIGGHEFTTYTYDKTGSGNEFEVFATLKAILEKFIKERDPKEMSFSADKDRKNNRARVYAKMFQKNLPKGWGVEMDVSPVAHEPVLFKIVKEALDKAKPYKVIKENDEYFSAKFKAGTREIVFYAELLDKRAWEIAFAQLKPDGKQMEYDLTKSGNELEVFATVGAIIKEFLALYEPDQVTFAAATRGGQENRASLYARLTKKFFPSDWKTHREDDDGVTFFTMLRGDTKKLDEGAMKRSDPYISGEKSGPRPPDLKLAPSPTTAHRTKLQTLVKKSGKTMKQVEAAWSRAAREVPDGPAKWVKVMKRAKADLGVSE